VVDADEAKDAELRDVVLQAVGGCRMSVKDCPKTANSACDLLMALNNERDSTFPAREDDEGEGAMDEW
jgi:hypothetical protein